jgi:hypothetical protein
MVEGLEDVGDGPDLFCQVPFSRLIIVPDQVAAEQNDIRIRNCLVHMPDGTEQ